MNERLPQMLDRVYAEMDGSEFQMDYSRRHGIKSAAILTVFDDDSASSIAAYLAPRIEGRTVIEIGGGIGLLALHIGLYAKRVYCFEANPSWASTFVAVLLASKPKNVSYLFGAADEFAGQIHGDVAIFCTHSDAAGMHKTGKLFCREVIDVYGEIVEPHWNELRDLPRSMHGAGTNGDGDSDAPR